MAGSAITISTILMPEWSRQNHYQQHVAALEHNETELHQHAQEATAQHTSEGTAAYNFLTPKIKAVSRTITAAKQHEPKHHTGLEQFGIGVGPALIGALGMVVAFSVIRSRQRQREAYNASLKELASELVNPDRFRPPQEKPWRIIG
jgi:hypothetical protein